jgi:surface antigen
VFAVFIHNANAQTTTSNQVVVSSSSGSSNGDTLADPLNQLSTAQIAVQVARMTGISESTAVANLADTENAAVNITQADSQVIAKPDISTTDAPSREDIVHYVTKPGDTVASLAQKYGVTSNSIIWSNSISGNTLNPGLSLVIPPVNGIAYTVKSGDTIASIAQKYNADPTIITDINDAEVSGIYAGEQIVIPNGSVAAPAVTSSYSSSASSYNNYAFGYSATYAGNGYDFGYCTWWVAQRRAQVGEPVPSNLGDASTWLILAQAAGIPTGSTPEKNAVIWFGYDANHVGFVESVDAAGNVTISEMNRDGWDVESTRVIPAAEASSYRYIY